MKKKHENQKNTLMLQIVIQTSSNQYIPIR